MTEAYDGREVVGMDRGCRSLGPCRDPGEENVDAGEKLVPVVVIAKLCGCFADDLVGVLFRPRGCQCVEVALTLGLVARSTRTGSELGSRPEDVVRQGCSGVRCS